MESFSQTTIEGLTLIVPEVFEDQRGEFVEIFNKDFYAQLFPSIPPDWKTDALAVYHRGVLKGLHGDWKTWKLIDAVNGRIFVAVVDARIDSKTHGETYTCVLTDRTHNQLLIPPGCATGTQCLSAACVLHYKQSEYYNGGDKQFTISYKDEILDIDWPIKIGAIVSARDRKGIRFIDLERT